MPRQEITSRQNPRVKEAARLRDARQRAKQGRFVIDGAREIGRALDAEIQIVEAFICPSLCGSEIAQAVASRLDDSNAVVAEVTSEVFEKLAFGHRHDGIVAVAATPLRRIGHLKLPEKPLVAVLEGLEKPGNVGAILRSADGAGVDAVMVVDPETDLFNPNTIRASVGTVFGRQVCVATVDEALAKLRELGVPLIATRPAAERLYTEVDFRHGAAIVLGTEATGLSAAWNQADITGVRLPMRGIADSLNVSTAAAVLFYEAERQRQGISPGMALPGS
jgi:TrmH family RNA methyltransferase